MSEIINIKRDLLKHIKAKPNDKSQRFGVIMTPFSRELFNRSCKLFDQKGFAEAKAYKRPRKIYYSTFRGHLHERVEGHARKSSSICKHYNLQHNSEMPQRFIEQFHIITKCSGKFDCLVKEMLYIRMRKPTLNVFRPFIVIYAYLVPFLICMLFN